MLAALFTPGDGTSRVNGTIVQSARDEIRREFKEGWRILRSEEVEHTYVCICMNDCLFMCIQLVSGRTNGLIEEESCKSENQYEEFACVYGLCWHHDEYILCPAASSPKL